MLNLKDILMKIAKYKSISGDYEIIAEVSAWYEESDEYVRLTEVKDVTFKPLGKNSTTKKQIVALQKAKKAAEKEYLKRLDYLSDRINSLKAIEHNPGYRDAN